MLIKDIKQSGGITFFSLKNTEDKDARSFATAVIKKDFYGGYILTIRGCGVIQMDVVAFSFEDAEARLDAWGEEFINIGEG